MKGLRVENLHVSVEGKDVLKGITLEVSAGTIHVVMGPNGAGKSSLALAIMGHPKYKITQGKILLDGEDITPMNATERAKRGLFLSFQYPSEVTGVTLSNFLRTAYNSNTQQQLDVLQFYKLLKEKMKLLHIEEQFATRYLNEGFSGGEKKKAEMLQLMILEPRYAIIDECDSGLDVSALKIVGKGLQAMKTKERGMLIITHYSRLLDYVQPDTVSIMQEGKIVKTGAPSLIKETEAQGFDHGKETHEATHH